MQTIKIRQATTKDIHVLTALAVETWTHAFAHTFTNPSDVANHVTKNLSVDRFKEALERDLILVAESKNRMLGFVQIGDLSNAKEQGDQELRRIYVVAAAQGQGIGQLLMDKALADPYLKRAKNVYLDVWEHNLGAQKFYRNYGFEVIGKRKFDVPSGAETSCDLIMVKRFHSKTT
jgi:ribosomal protein S18 acetylase RimI-like enzyme